MGLRATRADPQPWLKQERDALMPIASTHLDDLTCAGRDKPRQELVQALEPVLGRMTTHEKDFVHCGFRHRQPEDMIIEVDQTEYIKNLSCIDEKELQGMSDEADPPAKHVKLYPSLL